MGKKTRKTRWRTLSIDDNPSDTESQGGDFAKNPPRKWGATKFNSSNSTPTKSKWTSRSNSNASENKITFNEDEYTRITTPRQDVLFKKGYLSKPKQQNTSNSNRKSLTSAGNSTGDGTPDHISADGADYEQEPEIEFYPPEIYPTPLYYINYESQSHQQHPLLLYDPYGNTTTVYYPPNFPHPQMGGGEPTTNLPLPEEPTIDDENLVDLEKKRNSLDSDDFETGTETEGENSPSNTSHVGDDTSPNSAPKYRVDAEEFIPRNYQMNQQFVPLEMFPVVLVHPPLPQFYPHINPPALPPIETNHSNSVDIQSIVSKLEQAAEIQKNEEESKTDDSDKTKTETAEKMEEKIPEKFLEKVLTGPPEVLPSPTAVKPVPKVVPRPLKQPQISQQKTETQKYSDRLKIKTNAVKKPPAKQNTNANNRLTSIQTGICPRLNRTATVINTENNTTINKKTTDSDWVCVNNKKKRKQQRNNDEKQETIIESQQQLMSEPEVVQITSETIVENIEIKDLLTVENETIKDITIEECKTIKKEQTNDGNKVQKTKKQPQKKPKKRIIITDGALPIKVESSPPVVNLVTTEPITTIEPQIEEIIEQQVVPEKLENVQEISKKSKKKRNKVKNIQTTPPTLNLCENIDINDDISSELDRMITRGLYSTLEQRLQNYNPSDSFLTTLNSVTIPPTPRPNNPVVLSPLSPPVSVETEKAPLATGRITKAVQEWMEKTRERTPEVEIFRKPEELRQDVLDRVLVEDLEPLEQAEDVLVERSRSVSLSWDYDDCPNRPHSPLVEPALEVLEDSPLGAYNSVYGSAGDYQRIQSEVFGLRPANIRAPRDGGLPYRAICCSIM